MLCSPTGPESGLCAAVPALVCSHQCSSIYARQGLGPPVYSSCVRDRQGLGPESVRLYPLLTPVLRLSTDLNTDAHVYLMEDGLALWQAAVENAPQLHPDFMEVRCLQ